MEKKKRLPNTVFSLVVLVIIQDTLYKQIQSGTGITDVTQQAANDYDRSLEQWECRRKRVYEADVTAFPDD